MAEDTWHEFDFVVQMPHMAPGEKLSEVEFLKILAAYQWESIARALGRRPSQIVSPQKERLYGSVIDVEFRFAPEHGQDLMGEDVTIHVRNRIRFYAKKFVEGLFVIDDKPIPHSVVEKIRNRDDLSSYAGSWACMTNAFIARGGSNLKLKVFRPEGSEELDLPEMRDPPQGMREQSRVQSTGEMPPLPEPIGDLVPLADRRAGEPIVYTIVPESDLNGAGLVYFARYEAMMNYGERRFLCERLEYPISFDLVSFLSTVHRQAYFFGNAAPTDDVEVRVEASLIPPDGFTVPPGLPYRVPLQIEFLIELHRRSDKVLMAMSRVRKSLNVPGSHKGVITEAERWLRRLGLAG